MPTVKERVRLLKAKPVDAATLVQISKRAFDHDIHHGAPGPGGPPGYDSDLWQRRMMLAGDYFKIMLADRIVGGAIVFRKRPREYELGRIFVDPEFQNQGIGSEAFELLWQEYPLTKKWTLGTPAWNQRNRHFYAKLGFVEIGQDGRGGILFEKASKPPS